jgi:uncharacterized iron-regulated membrane protein
VAMLDRASRSDDGLAIEPRPVGLRPSIRRLHFCLGAVAMLYIIFVSASGCAIVFEHELYRFFLPHPPIVASGDGPLDIDTLKSVVATRYPQKVVAGIWERRLSAGLVAEVWLEGSTGTTRRLVHPQTGEDLGDAQPFSLRALEFLRGAHVSALAGNSGRFVNAMGAVALIVLSMSGIAMRDAGRNGAKTIGSGSTGRSLVRKDCRR